MGESQFLRLTLATALLLVVGCSGGGDVAEEGTAAAAVQTFYDHLNAGRYDDAKALYTEETRQQVFPDAAADDGFREWASAETHQGGLTKFEVIGEAEADAGTTVEFELRFSDGATARRQVTVYDEGGVWRLGIIG